MRHLLLSILVPILFLGCSSSLTVQVDIFDEKGLKPEDIVKASVEKEASQHVYLLRTGAYPLAKKSLKSQLAEYVRKLSEPKLGVVAEKDVKKFIANSNRAVDTALDGAVQLRNGAIDQARIAETIANMDKRREAFESSLGEFAKAQKTLNQLKVDFLKPYQGLLKEKLSELEVDENPDRTLINNLMMIDATTSRQVEKSFRTLTGGFDLFDDPLAPFIISAPDNYWKGVFNRTEASGQIGNTDIAVKMETLGTFTIKGVRLDASKVTEASFQVLKQSVKLVAAAYGIPTPGGTPPPVGEQSSEGPNEIIMNIDQLRQTAQLSRQKSRYAALSLLDIIISERLDLLSTEDTIRKAALSRIKKSFMAYKPQLSGEQ